MSQWPQVDRIQCPKGCGARTFYKGVQYGNISASASLDDVERELRDYMLNQISHNDSR